MTWSDEWEVQWGAGSSLDLVALARSRVFTRLRTIESESNDPSVEDVVEWIVQQLQTVEDTIDDIRTFVPLANAYGYQLDLHGAAVRQLRGGLSDDDYRATLIAIYGSISQRRTTVLIRSILELLTLGSDTTFSVQEYRPAAFEVTLYNVTAARAALIEAIIRRAKPEGVRFTLHFIVDTTTVFRFDTPGQGFDTPGIGFTTTIES